MARAIEWRREPSSRGFRRPHLLGWLDQRRQERRDLELVQGMAQRWLATCFIAHLAKDTESCAGIPGTSAPRLLSIVLADHADRLTVEMLPGQTAKDFREQAARLAEGMRVPQVRITQRKNTPGYLVVELLHADPLAHEVMLPLGAGAVSQQVLFAESETGEEIAIPLLDCAHIIAQGQTRSGKSRWTYGLLAQLAGCPDITFAGSDITGLIARAFDNTRHAPFWASGSADIEAHCRVLEDLVAEMDRRNASMPRTSDVYPISETDPLLFVVIEELAGLIEAAQAADAGRKRGEAKYADRIRGAYKRLMGEGAKAGIRVLLLVQRAEATIVGGFARGQASLRLSFRVDDGESVKLLHPGVERVTAEEHATATPAIALVSGPGLPLVRARAPHMPSYEHFLHLIEQQCGPADHDLAA